MCFFFFFSSRRRHTRCSRDWSSDVCSSDLVQVCHGLGAQLVGVGLDPLGRAQEGGLLTVPRCVDDGEEPALLGSRSEEHTSELQSRLHLVCRLLLEKKKKKETVTAQVSRPISVLQLY